MYPYRYAPGVEVIGLAARAIFNQIEQSEIIDLLEAHGVAQLEVDQWYPVNTFIDVFAELHQRPQVLTTTLVAVGIAIIENVDVPPEAVEWPMLQKLSLIKLIHDGAHRPTTPGGYQGAMKLSRSRATTCASLRIRSTRMT